MNKITARLLRTRKSKTTYCYQALVRVNNAKELCLSNKEGLLLKINKNEMFPTVVNIRPRKDRKCSFFYTFTVPKNLVNDSQNKDIEFEIISRAKIEEVSNKQVRSSMIDLKGILSLKTVKNHNIYKFGLDENKLLIWIYSRSHVKYFIFPRFVPLEVNDISFFELMGFLFSEGAKYRRSGGYSLDVLSFSNEDEEQIEWCLQAIELLLGTKKTEWEARINHPRADAEEHHLKKFWSNVGLSYDRITVYPQKDIKSEFGVCKPYISSIVLGEVFFELINYAKSIALKTRKNAISFFRGLSRGDIGVSYGRKEKAVNFTTKEEKDILYFCDLCRKIGLRTGKPYFNEKKKYWGVKITGYDNFKKIIKFCGITHLKRKHKLLKIFLTALKSTPYKYLKAVSIGANTSKKAAKYLKLSVISTRAYFHKLKKEGLIEGSDYKKYNLIVYKLTESGRKELKFYDEIKKELIGV